MLSNVIPYFATNATEAEVYSIPDDCLLYMPYKAQIITIAKAMSCFLYIMMIPNIVAKLTKIMAQI